MMRSDLSVRPSDLEDLPEAASPQCGCSDQTGLGRRLAEKLQSLAGSTNTVLFVTDIEALHPYLRVGVLEQQLQGRFTVPTVFLYPGVRDGKTTLKFLGIYPADGNYRSVHIGG